MKYDLHYVAAALFESHHDELDLQIVDEQLELVFVHNSVFASSLMGTHIPPDVFDHRCTLAAFENTKFERQSFRVGSSAESLGWHSNRCLKQYY
jgi:hypothetical protein